LCTLNIAGYPPGPGAVPPPYAEQAQYPGYPPVMQYGPPPPGAPYSQPVYPVPNQQPYGGYAPQQQQPIVMQPTSGGNNAIIDNID